MQRNLKQEKSSELQKKYSKINADLVQHNHHLQTIIKKLQLQQSELFGENLTLSEANKKLQASKGSKVPFFLI